MKTFDRMPYARQLKWKLRIWRCVLVLMLAYVVIISELGGGDSRLMTNAMHATGCLIYLFGMVWVIVQIVRIKKLLPYPNLMKESLLLERDERHQYLHDKSGGLVWDVTFVCLLIATLTASLYNEAAFLTAWTILALSAALKLTTWHYYNTHT